MPKLDICDLCHFYAHNPHLVCTIHPAGVDGESCLDFRVNQRLVNGDPMEAPRSQENGGSRWALAITVMSW